MNKIAHEFQFAFRKILRVAEWVEYAYDTRILLQKRYTSGNNPDIS